MAHGDEKSTETMEGLLSDLETPKIFSPEQLRTFTSNFSIRLGSGSFGDVYKGTLHNGVQVAVKVLKGALLSDAVKDQFKAEVSIHGKIHHKYVVKLYGFCFEQNMKALVYEFMENGSLDKLLYGNQSIAWETLCNIAVGTAKGLAYLHEYCQPSIIQYDVKPANILLDSKFSPKVGDFGLAKLLNQDTTHITESRFRGTPNYSAPELLTRYSRVTNKCDVFSFGITLFDIIGRRRHVRDEGEKWFPVQVWTKFKEEKQEEIMQECDIHEMDRKHAKQILLVALWCVQFSPGDRPSMSRVVRLLEGTEEVKLPPNPFLYMGFSSVETEEDKKDNISHMTLGPWGGRDESYWDDGISAGIKKIKLYIGIMGSVSGIKVWYCKKDGEPIFRRHGNCETLTKTTIELDYPSEYLMRVTGFYGDVFYNRGKKRQHVKSLCFFTNKKIYGPFGDEKGTYFTSENDGKDGKIVGFHGRERRYSLEAIGVHMEYNKDRQRKLKITRIIPTSTEEVKLPSNPFLMHMGSSITATEEDEKDNISRTALGPWDEEKSLETIEGLPSDLEMPNFFSHEQLKKFTAGFSKCLGSGAFGDVFKGVLHDGVQVAVKVLKRGILSEAKKDQFIMEVGILGKIHHKHVVKLYGFCFEQNMKALVYELMETGSLDKLLYGNQSIAWETLCNIAVGTAKGLAYLHEDCQPSIIHYDVKPANILLDSKFSPKIGDVGLAKIINQDTTHITATRFRGTPIYGAPELCMPYSQVTDKCDVFSFGISLFDVIGRRRHVRGEDQQWFPVQVRGEGEKWFPVLVWKKFVEEEQEEIMQECDIHEKDRKQAKQILLIALWCVQFSPGDRPSMSRVVRLLEGMEEIAMPPNPFSYSRNGPHKLKASSRFTEEVKLPLNPFLVHMGSSKAVTEGDREGNISRKTLGPWGGREGSRFDDGIFAGIKKIKVFKGIKGDVYAIRVWYCGKDGESISTGRHGDCEADTIDTIELDYPNEYLVRVTGFHSYGKFDRVRSLCFFSNMKKYGPFGVEKGSYFSTEKDGKDGKVIGFHGRAEDRLNAIGMHMEYSL